ncbi:MAG: hypothetical protein KDB22_05065 [Planctomycetales bacterium]|nr:hypothetical protein [Planctomycetales bacterium]
MTFEVAHVWGDDSGTASAQATSDQNESPEDGKHQDERESPISEFKVSTVLTEGKMVLDGQEIEYTVETGMLTQASDAADEKASVFFIAYRRPTLDESNRPVTFAFNGGPGSSSVWLHLGMLGPQRIKLPDDASFLRPPYKLANNPFSLLDVTDLVFIDPVSTGYSRPAKDEEKSQFHGYDEDVRSVGQFIHDWTSHYRRWESPKFIFGESYGGLRAAGLARHLQSRYNLELNGVVVISGAINFQTLRFGNGNDLPYVCFLPTYAATAWYHKALGVELQALPVAEVVKLAEEFAYGQYADTLLRGSAASAEQLQETASEYSRLTGIAQDYVTRSNLRISMPQFGKELLRVRGKTTGRFDSRYLGMDRSGIGESTEYDPSGAAIFGPFTATMNQYLREVLEYEQPRTYEILTGNVQPWNYDTFTGRYVDGSEALRSAMTANPYLRLYVACGYYDLATPHFAMQYTLDHLGLETALQSNIRVSRFEGGHMMYIYEPAMQRLRSELVDWYRDAVGSP